MSSPDPDWVTERLQRHARQVQQRVVTPDVATVRRRGRGAPAVAVGLVAALLLGLAALAGAVESDRAEGPAAPAAPPGPTARANPAESLLPVPPASASASRPPPTGRPPASRTAAPAPRPRRHLLVDGSFESAGLGGFTQQLDPSSSLGVVPGPVRGGRHAVRVDVAPYPGLKDQPFGAELRAGGAGGPYRDRDRWFGFSLQLPSDWDGRATEDGKVGLFAVAQPGGDCDRGPSPLTLVTVGETMRWTARWDREQCTPDPGGTDDGVADLAVVPLVRGAWTDWVVHLRWGHRGGGIVEVWFNGKKIIDYRGPVGYNDPAESYLKAGLTQSGGEDEWPPGLDRRTLYLDELRIGDGAATYADVAP